jgi:hypothetical protein
MRLLNPHQEAETMGNGRQDARGAKKAERHYYDRTNLQACIVCGRLFTNKRKDAICSIACAEKAEAEKKEGQV